MPSPELRTKGHEIAEIDLNRLRTVVDDFYKGGAVRIYDGLAGTVIGVRFTAQQQERETKEEHADVGKQRFHGNKVLKVKDWVQN